MMDVRMPIYVRVCLAAVLLFAGYKASAQDAGADNYATICAACHQPTGLGLPDTFPPLAGHAAAILNRPGGRDFLARLLVYGEEGEITAGGKTFNSTMPPWGETSSDEQLAGALNYALHSWGNDKLLPPGFTLFLPAEIAAARATKMTAGEVYALRGQVVPKEAPAEAQGAVQGATVPVAFTADQAARGQAAYRRACQDCHGFNLNDGEFGGAPLNGGYFARHWGGGGVSALYGYLTAKMPPDRPGKLNPQTYADLAAFLLSKNGYAPGQSELPPDPDAQKNMTLKR
jgi:mono/diheme cytochrome c family protein